MERQIGQISPAAKASADELNHWRRRHRFYHRALQDYLRFMIPEGHSVLLLGCEDGALLEALRPLRGVGVDRSAEMIALARRWHGQFEYVHCAYHKLEVAGPFEYIVLNDMAGEVQDLITLMDKLAGLTTATGRVIIAQHNYLLRPLLRLAAAYGFKRPEKPQNWLSAGDIETFLYAAGLETVQVHSKLFAPINPFGLGRCVNFALGLVPWAHRLASTQLIVARLLSEGRPANNPTCTICLTTRNERENIEPMVRMIPPMDTETEVLFVEGHSTDGTREEIERIIQRYPQKNIRLAIQAGKGQGDAIRLGFREAKGDIVVLLEADQTSPAEDVIKAWRLIAQSRADYVNGSRFIYPMEAGAMGLRNWLGNWLFALWFGWFLGQRTSDVLCGIKAVSKKQFQKIDQNWGFLQVSDPFGDFELIFGAARLGLKICEVPTRYSPRQHGQTKTRFFRHGWMLLKMALAATGCFKCR